MGLLPRLTLMDTLKTLKECTIVLWAVARFAALAERLRVLPGLGPQRGGIGSNGAASFLDHRCSGRSCALFLWRNA